MLQQPFQAFEDRGAVGLLDGDHDDAGVIRELLREGVVVITVGGQDHRTDLPGQLHQDGVGRPVLTYVPEIVALVPAPLQDFPGCSREILIEEELHAAT
jgi:hypothetical protein